MHRSCFAASGTLLSGSLLSGREERRIVQPPTPLNEAFADKSLLSGVHTKDQSLECMPGSLASNCKADQPPFLTSSSTLQQWGATKQLEELKRHSSPLPSNGASTSLCSLSLCKPRQNAPELVDAITSPATCDSCVSVWKRGNRTIYLLGAIHISSKSADLAGQVVKDVKPNAVMVELCLKRAGLEPFEGTSSEMIHELSGFYVQMEEAGIRTGGEIIQALEEGQKVGATLILGDQDIEVTLHNVATALEKIDREKVCSSNSDLVKDFMDCSSDCESDDADKLWSKEEVQQFLAEVKEMEDRKLWTKLICEAKDIAPGFVHAFITERDAHMATLLSEADEFDNIVAVVGIAHLDGMEEELSSKGWKKVTLPC